MNLSTSGLASRIGYNDRFARDASGSLHVYQDGYYQSGERYVRQQVKELSKRLRAEWHSGLAEEVIKYIAVDAPELWPVPPSDVINLQNGLLDVLTGELRPHSPDFLSMIQLPVRFDPKANGAAWPQFLWETFPQDSQDTAWEIPAWTMLPENSIQKAVLLSGPGANGKSVYLAGLCAFLGKRNVCGISLHKLEQDRFAGSRLVGKLANICPDIPNAKLVGTSVFKALTGGDLFHAEEKYKPSFEFAPITKLIFSTNAPPLTDDATFAYFRRWHVVPFSRTFVEGAPSTVPRAELDARLSDPYELSTLLNLALTVLPRLRSQGFTVSGSIRAALGEFQQLTDPLLIWLDQHLVVDPTGVIPKRELIDLYKAACVAAKRAPMTDTGFGLALRRAFPFLQDRRVNGVESYLGIKWKGIGWVIR